MTTQYLQINKGIQFAKINDVSNSASSFGHSSFEWLEIKLAQHLNHRVTRTVYSEHNAEC